MNHDSYTKSCCDFEHDQSGKPSITFYDLCHDDHSYATSNSIVDSLQNPSEIQKILNNVLDDTHASLGEQITNMSKPNTSVLWKREPDRLIHENDFEKCIEEMSAKCRLLLSIPFRTTQRSHSHEIKHNHSSVVIVVLDPLYD